VWTCRQHKSAECPHYLEVQYGSTRRKRYAIVDRPRERSEAAPGDLEKPVARSHCSMVLVSSRGADAEEGSGLEDGDEASFRRFVLEVEPRLRRALVATYGLDRGREATAEALGWAWENRDQLEKIDSPVRYLYRVGQSRSRARRERPVYDRPAAQDPWIEPKLAAALARLSTRQRVSAFLVHGAGWTPSEVADLLGVDVSTVQTHLGRAMTRLRREVKGGVDERDRCG
jgi:RNA polymerase sigma factor (sigma-70 family)